MIVGAGISGIAAATKLMENGFNDITILEAENRTGGRIHSVSFADGYIDLGAQTCHGEKDNAIYEMVHDYFEFSPAEYGKSDFNFLLSNGQLANQEQCSRLELLLNKIYETVQGQNKSIGSVIEERFWKDFKSSNYSDIDELLARQMLSLFEKQICADYATESWFNISLTYSNLYIRESAGNQIMSWKREGFKKVFDFLTVRIKQII